MESERGTSQRGPILKGEGEESEGSGRSSTRRSGRDNLRPCLVGDRGRGHDHSPDHTSEYQVGITPRIDDPSRDDAADFRPLVRCRRRGQRNEVSRLNICWYSRCRPFRRSQRGEVEQRFEYGQSTKGRANLIQNQVQSEAND